MNRRRDFLKTSALISMSPLIPGFIGKTAFGNEPDNEAPILVVVEMNGGNDGLNTVVPFGQSKYRRYRQRIRIQKNQVLKLNEEVGLNPAMQGFKQLYDDGTLAIINSVGYPNPNRSHFESMAIWHSANVNGSRPDGNGWLGQYLDESAPKERLDLDGWFVGAGTVPPVLVTRRSQIASVERLQDLQFQSLDTAKRASQLGNGVPRSDVNSFVSRCMTNSFASAEQLDSIMKSKTTDVRFPATALGNKLSIVSRLIRSGAKSRAYYTVQAGYDTHAAQLGAHTNLLSELSSSVKAFVDDLKQAKLDQQVVVLMFSEFGRRVEENESQGTDHGTAGPVFVMGTHVKGGLYGDIPDLSDLKQGDLKVKLDFRRVYSTLLDKWLMIPSEKVLERKYDSLKFI
jgi:uncharacterized protein (DUF1501 family)